MTAGCTLYRRSRNLVLYWQDDGIVIHNYATGVHTRADPAMIELLDQSGTWKTVSELCRLSGSRRRGDLERLVSQLVDATQMEASTDPPDPRELAMERWGPWNPIAGLFHRATRDVVYEVRDGPRKQRRHPFHMDSPSVPLKARPGSDTIELPDFSCDGEFPRVLTQRRTWRQFGPDALSLADLSSLLGLTWGVQHWMHPGGGAKLPLKTSPSGGARHSLEAYVIAVRIEHMAPGIYHYCPDEHRLSFVSAEAPRPLLERGLPGQPGFHEASAVFLMSTLVERVQARYRSPRAYRVILLEAGHFCQTLCLVATWLGLAPFCTAALNETSLEEHLGIDGMSESVIYAAGVGARPEGVAWAPFPEPGAVPPKLTPPSYREREKGRS